ncbi:MAG: hypothetical protein JWN39_3319 [Ilumatobacteraceae bacterium]|nr:hypothetical protein [Ilumatobacteraceae bacterium]
MTDQRDPVVFESDAQLVRAVPITLWSRPGRLRLTEQRLTFTARKGAVLVDVEVPTLHSPATSVPGVTVWSGEQRFRFALGATQSYTNVRGPVSGAVAVSRLPAQIETYRMGRQLAKRWAHVLAAAVTARPPAGLRVRPPWPQWRWILTVVTGTFAAMGVLLTLAVLING